MDKIQLMKSKIELLNKAAKAYYQENRRIMSNYEYDKLYDELEELEKETGTVLSNSPTIRVGYELLTGLPKERHEKPCFHWTRQRMRQC
jgi:DNA ligase (NAD+)